MKHKWILAIVVLVASFLSKILNISYDNYVFTSFLAISPRHWHRTAPGGYGPTGTGDGTERPRVAPSGPNRHIPIQWRSVAVGAGRGRSLL